MVHHITAANSVIAQAGDALSLTTAESDSLLVDANAYLISPSGGDGIALIGSWTVTINGEVEAFGNGYVGLTIAANTLSGFANVTVGRNGHVFGDIEGLLLDSGTSKITNHGTILARKTGILAVSNGHVTIINSGLIQGGSAIGYAALQLSANTGTINNSGTINGDIFSSGETHLTNSGKLEGRVQFGGGYDTFTNFQTIHKVIKSGTVSDVIDLGDGNDHFKGGANREVVRDGGGSDTYNFGGGSDSYIAVKNGGGLDGADTVNGGSGKNDYYDASGSNSFVLINLDTKAHDLTPIAPGEGFVAARAATGADVGVDQITGFENAYGGSAGDILYGSAKANILSGLGGGDNLFGYGGNDELHGGAGVDGIAGGTGKDTLFGGSEGDYFQYFVVGDSGITAATRDVIMDFEQGSDFIDVSILNALRGVGGTFIGVQNFHKLAGEYRQSDSGANTIVWGDINGDGKADFSIELKGHFVLQSGDFVF